MMKRILYFWINGLLVFVIAACSASTTLNQPVANTVTVNDQLAISNTPPPSVIPETAIPTVSPTEVKVEVTVTSVPTLTPTEPAMGSTRVTGQDKMEQVYVPAGKFLMGAEKDPLAKTTWTGGRAAPEIPSFEMTLEGYWIDKFEVTNGQWALCVAAGACKLPRQMRSYTRTNYYDDPKYANYPVASVDWYMATDYCKWAGRRLPTEAEWEKAARGTDGRLYPWGNEPVSGERANFCDVGCPRNIANSTYNDGYTDTAPVGSYPKGASPYGAMDMAGNVWEWTSTIIQAYPYYANDGREDPNLRAERVWRGGTYSDGTWWLRSSLRYRSVQTYYISNLGLRCASTR